jgi:hypothetical protein
MKHTLIISSLIGIIGYTAACKTSKNNKQEANMNPTSNTCTLRIEFYSIGSGTDYVTIDKLNKYLESKKISFETKPWGREGEVTYCLKFSDRKTNEINSIKKEVKKLLETSQLVRYEEDKPLTK